MSTEDSVLLADGFEDAFIGFAHPWQNQHVPTAIYDRKKCIKILMDRDKMTQEEAEDYFEFNVSGAYVGESTPIFVNPCTIKECQDWLDDI